MLTRPSALSLDPSAVAVEPIAGLTAENLSAENPPKKFRLAEIDAKNVRPNTAGKI